MGLPCAGEAMLATTLVVCTTMHSDTITVLMLLFIVCVPYSLSIAIIIMYVNLHVFKVSIYFNHFVKVRVSREYCLSHPPNSLVLTLQGIALDCIELHELGCSVVMKGC